MMTFLICLVCYLYAAGALVNASDLFGAFAGTSAPATY